jgi:MFS family permease
MFVANRTIPELRGGRGRQDYWGAGTIFVFFFFLLMFINRAQASGLSGVNAGMLALGLGAGISFLFIEKRSDQPMLDLGLFRNVTFSFASLSALLNFMAQYVVIFLTPFHLHRVLHFPPNKVGLIMTSFPLAVMAVAPFSGWIADRTGMRGGLSCLGALICSSSMLFLGLLQDSATAAQVSLGLVIFGVGTGIFQAPNTSAAMSGISRHELGIASSILAAMRNVGMVMGIAMAGAILHALVANEILEKHSLNLFESGLFSRGLDAAFIAGAVVSALGAVTSLIKK